VVLAFPGGGFWKLRLVPRVLYCGLEARGRRCGGGASGGGGGVAVLGSGEERFDLKSGPGGVLEFL
jgi:hypothetical protein